MKTAPPVQRLGHRRERRVFRRKTRQRRWQQLLIGLACSGAGLALIVGLRQLIQQLDAFLLFSEALSHLISGLTNLGIGLGQLLLVLLLLLATLAGLLLLLAGLIRFGRTILPARSGESPPSKPAGKARGPLSAEGRGAVKRRRP